MKTNEDEMENSLEEEQDKLGHIWGMGWQDSDKPHPGFGGSQNIYGGIVGQCEKCGMYDYECYGTEASPGKFEKQSCGEKIR